MIQDPDHAVRREHPTTSRSPCGANGPVTVGAPPALVAKTKWKRVDQR